MQYAYHNIVIALVAQTTAQAKVDIGTIQFGTLCCLKNQDCAGKLFAGQPGLVKCVRKKGRFHDQHLESF